MGIWTDAYGVNKRNFRFSDRYRAECAFWELVVRRKNLRQYELESYAALGRKVATEFDRWPMGVMFLPVGSYLVSYRVATETL